MEKDISCQRLLKESRNRSSLVAQQVQGLAMSLLWLWELPYVTGSAKKKKGKAILISDRANFRAKKLSRDKGQQSIFPEDITIHIVYAPNNRVSVSRLSIPPSPWSLIPSTSPRALLHFLILLYLSEGSHLQSIFLFLYLPAHQPHFEERSSHQQCQVS